MIISEPILIIIEMNFLPIHIGGEIMPLSMVREGESSVIKKVSGKEETRKFLEKLGFVTGSTVTVVSEIGGNIIVNVKDSRVAIGKDMANKIIV